MPGGHAIADDAGAVGENLRDGGFRNAWMQALDILPDGIVEPQFALFAQFHDLVTGKFKPDAAEARAMGEIAAFSGVSRFPVRVKCASMPWHTLQKALHDDETHARSAVADDIVTTTEGR